MLDDKPEASCQQMPAQPKLIYVINSMDRGGAELGLLHLVRAGMFQGFDLKIISLVRGQGGVETALEKEGVSIEFLRDVRQMGVVDLAVAFFKLLGIFRRERPRVVIASLPQSNIISRLALLSSQETILVTFEHSIRLAKPVYEVLYKWTGSKVDWVFGDSEVTLQEALRSRYVHAPRKSSFVPLLELPAPCTKKVRKCGEPFRVITAARFTKEKNLEVVIKAVAELRAQGHEIELTLYGEGPGEEAYRSLAKSLCVTEQVLFPGFVEDWATNPADLFVVASHREGLCLALAEAMNAGIPAVAPLIGGINDYADSSMLEVLSAVDAETIAHAIRLVKQDWQRALVKADLAQKLISQRFGKEKVRQVIGELNLQLRRELETYT
ncbi:glycosyltransferase [Ovoidimarina sediminis]|uniref:glycosyltransferase n=1 Tax=Ovoidimarina sediminis TaxID=3079856 RepID=UPI00290E354F|nr:glycosyltransferase [Rhodophyticola sp. MJ-SS7]MDU8945530.1 glycosyltransferase [Rhodophyticola sp. MJ-SS7]